MKLDSKGFFFVVAAASVLLSACAPNVYVEQDSTARFTGYRTYAWVAPDTSGPVNNPILDSQILESRIRRAVATDLKQRGYTPAADPAQADFLLTYHTTSREKVEDSGVGFGFGIVDAFPRGFGTVMVAPSAQPREEGTLMLDLIDGKSKRLVWRGWTSGWLNQNNYTDAAVADAVHQILDKLPAH